MTDNLSTSYINSSLDSGAFGSAQFGNMDIVSDTFVYFDYAVQNITIREGCTLSIYGNRFYVRGNMTLEAGASISNNGFAGIPGNYAEGGVTGFGGIVYADPGGYDVCNGAGGVVNGRGQNSLGVGVPTSPTCPGYPTEPTFPGGSLGGRGGEGGVNVSHAKSPQIAPSEKGGSGGTVKYANIPTNSIPWLVMSYGYVLSLEPPFKYPIFRGGSGGGSGASYDGESGSGSGGGGGGGLLLFVNNFIPPLSGVPATITVDGGRGGTGFYNSCGGGGGGGGYVIITTRSPRSIFSLQHGSNVAGGLVVTANGGAGGVSDTLGSASWGTAGGSGRVMIFNFP